MSCEDGYPNTDFKLNSIAGGGEVRDNSGQDEQAFNPQRPEVLANNPRSNGAVCFKQHLAQPVVNPMVAPSTVVSGPEEHGVEADSISAMRMCKWTNLNPQPVLRLAQDGLIKIKSSSFSGSAGTLHDFCKFGVWRLCPAAGLTFFQTCTPFVRVEHSSKIMLTSTRSC